MVWPDASTYVFRGPPPTTDAGIAYVHLVELPVRVGRQPLGTTATSPVRGSKLGGAVLAMNA